MEAVMEERFAMRLSSEKKKVYETAASVMGLSLSEWFRWLADTNSGEQVAAAKEVKTKSVKPASVTVKGKTVQIPQATQERYSCYCMQCKIFRANGSTETCDRVKNSK
jgi:hypothetical protein